MQDKDALVPGQGGYDPFGGAAGQTGGMGSSATGKVSEHMYTDGDAASTVSGAPIPGGGGVAPGYGAAPYYGAPGYGAPGYGHPGYAPYGWGHPGMYASMPHMGAYQGGPAMHRYASMQSWASGRTHEFNPLEMRNMPTTTVTMGSSWDDFQKCASA